MYVNLFDYAPRIGSGWRRVEVVSEGWKWVKIKYRPKSIAGGYIFERPIIGKITKKTWDSLPKKERLFDG